MIAGSGFDFTIAHLTIANRIESIFWSFASIHSDTFRLVSLLHTSVKVVMLLVTRTEASTVARLLLHALGDVMMNLFITRLHLERESQ